MTKKMKIILGLVVAAGVVAGTISYKNANSSSSPEVQEVEEAEKLNPVGPAFNADSALAYCQVQCDFGPRVMNSEAHGEVWRMDCEQIQAVWMRGGDPEGRPRRVMMARY